MLYFTAQSGRKSTALPLTSEPILALRDAPLGFDPTPHAGILGQAAYEFSRREYYSPEWRRVWPLARHIASKLGLEYKRHPWPSASGDSVPSHEALFPYVRFLVEQGLVPFALLTEYDKDLIFITLPPTTAPRPVKTLSHPWHSAWRHRQRQAALSHAACPAAVPTGHLGTQNGVSACLERNYKAPGEFTLTLTINGTQYWPMRVTYEKEKGYLRVLKSELRFADRSHSDVERIAYQFIDATTARYIRLHRLLLALWLQQDLRGKDIDHRNANRADNRLVNLDPLNRKQHMTKHWTTWIHEANVGGPNQHQPGPARTARTRSLLKHRGVPLVQSRGTSRRLIQFGAPSSYRRRFGLPSQMVVPLKLTGRNTQ